MAIRTRSLLGAIASSIVAACYSPEPEPPISSTADDSDSSDGSDDGDDDGSGESSESGTDCDVEAPPMRRSRVRRRSQ
jgi:hypothetical protein